MTKLIKILKLVLSIAICQSVGIIGSFFTVKSIPTWYSYLQKPFFAPPNWLFGPVWITLYTLMGISLYLVWNKSARSKIVKTALIIFGIQLLLNALWSLMFFGFKSPLYGLINIIFLWVAILLTIYKFYGISKNAAILLIPYIIWVTSAAFLNYFIFILN